MLRTTLGLSFAALLATVSTAAMASANENRYFHHAYVGDTGLLVDASENNDENDGDVVSIAEPVYAAVPERVSYATQYVPVNDTIATPYGYNPYYNNGYYQGYGYNPQYAYNPYYLGATYGGADPVSAAVVNTVVTAALNGGHVNGRDVVQSLVGGILAGQAQEQYQQQYQQQEQYPQQYQQYPVYRQQYPVYPVYQPRYNGRHNDGQGDNNDEDNNDEGGGD